MAYLTIEELKARSVMDEIKNITSPVQQVETITVTGGATADADVNVIVTAEGLVGSPVTVAVPVINGDTITDVSSKIIIALQSDAEIIALFDVSGADADVVLTKINAEANDTTLNIEINGSANVTGVPDVATSVDTIAGVVDEDNDAKLQALLNYCTLLIESYVGFSFALESGKTISIDGDGDNQLALPQRIIAITSITNLTSNYSYDINSIRIVGNNQKRLISSLDTFQQGYYNIEIVGDFGYTTVPEDVLDALTLLCNGYFYIIDDSDTLKKMTGPFAQEQIGDYSYKLASKIGSITSDNVDTTGNPNVDQILSKYREILSIGVV